ncbi:MAG: hypothetical protein ACYDDF_11105 [Thermoplasmatota archaeon]
MAPNPVTFEAVCPECGKTTQFSEGRKDRRKADFTVETLFFFLGACGHRSAKVLDAAGVLHKWNGNRHATYKPGT